MRRSPERVAWTVLLASFTIFCLLSVAVPLGVRYYLHHATRSQEATLKTLRGTIVVEDPRGGVEKPVQKGESLLIPEGASIYVDEMARANLSFFDNSFLVLYPGTRLSLGKMTAPRFRFGTTPLTIILNQKGGGIRVDTVAARSQPLVFEVRSSHLDSVVRLRDDGSYTIQVTNDRMEITVHRGEAAVTARNETVIVAARQRTTVEVGNAPAPPIPAARDIVTNGDFAAPLDEGWRVYNDQGADGGTVDGEATLTLVEGRRAVHFVRTGGQFNHCETVLEQDINYEFPDPPSSLMIRAVVKINYHLLSGGGYQSSEYPLMIRLVYQDEYGSQAEWVQGFYYHNIDNNPVMYGVEVPQNQWYLFESDNLLPTLPIVPSRILRLRVYASGWDYDSMISQINVIVE